MAATLPSFTPSQPAPPPGDTLVSTVKQLAWCCWEQSSITQGQLSGCGSYLSFSLSSLQIRPHTYSHNPKTARLRSIVGSPLTKHSVLAGSQQRGTSMDEGVCERKQQAEDT
ncbi:hypothetical protein NQZ68_008282, partial [Dissostichus eleginoides]